MAHRAQRAGAALRDTTGVFIDADVADAAVEHMAALAGHGDAAGMQHTRCDSFVWVRLEGQRRREEWVLPVTATSGEAAWPVGRTSH